MKGKHQRTQQRRREHALAAETERLRAEIEVETQRAIAARGRAAQVGTARTRLKREHAVTRRRTKPVEHFAGQLVANAAHGIDAIGAAFQDLHAVQRELSVINAKNTLQDVWQAGIKIRLHDVHPTPPPDFVKTWYRRRTGRELTPTRDLPVAGWVPDDVSGDRAALAPYLTSTVHDTTPEACWAWAIPPWMAQPTDIDDAAELRAQLGTTTTGRPVLARAPYPRRLRGDATITTPWRHAPVVGEVNDAADLAYWYDRSAWTQRWHHTSQAVPFWLPAEHAVSYPQAQPLPDGTDLRLPHPLVLVAFASPWRIQPRPSDVRTGLQSLLLHARGSAAHNLPEAVDRVLGRLQATGLTDRADLPTPLELLDHYGGTVEGLLLTANDDGTPADDFAWCLAIYHPCGFPLARFAVPASRAKTLWRQQVDSIIAGIALSCWHEPAGTRPARAVPEQRVDQAESDELLIRILDIDATSPRTASDDHNKPGVRPSRPHLRRGHWRRQRVGPHRGDARWTWVRATTVNATSVPVNQVYVLR